MLGDAVPTEISSRVYFNVVDRLTSPNSDTKADDFAVN